MKGVDKMKHWLELEEARTEGNICRSCFKDTLNIVLSKKVLKDFSEDKPKKNER